MVKQRFRDFAQGCTCPKDFPVCVCGKQPRGKILLKGLAPSEQELSENYRAHSARLRSVQKLKD